MSDYRVDIKVRNNNLLRRLEEGGYKTIGEFCRRNNVMTYATALGEIVAMKVSPLNKNGEFKPAIKFLAKTLMCDELELFNENQFNKVLKENKRTILVNEAEMQYLAEQKDSILSLEEDVFNDQKRQILMSTLDPLPPREKTVITLLYGITGDEPLNTHEIANILKVSPARVLQLHAAALRRLRHSFYTDKLLEIL